MRFTKIIKLIQTKTAKDTFLVFGGNVVAGLIGMVLLIIISRKLGPADFGVFSIAFSLMIMMVKLGDFGLNFALVKDISQSRARRQEAKISKIVLTVFWAKAIICFFLVVTGVFLIPFISLKVFNSLNSLRPNRLVIIFFPLVVFYELIKIYFEANKKFFEGVLMYIITNFIKIIMISSCLFFNLLNPKVAITSYLLSPFLTGLIFLKETKIRLKFYFDKLIFKDLFKFSSWMFLSVIFSALGENLNVFMVSAKLSEFETGIYSAAEKFILPFYVLAASLATVLIPRASELLNLGQVKEFTKKIIFLQIGLLFMFIAIFPLANILPFLLGESFTPSVAILKILIIASSPLNSVFYPLNKPFIFAFNAFTQLSLQFLLNQKLIPSFYGRGAALSMLITNIIIFITNFLFLFFLLKSQKKVKI